MLVLSRKVGERVLVGDSIIVTVLESRGRTVKLGIEAPRALVVLRDNIVSRSLADTCNTLCASSRHPVRPDSNEESKGGMARDRIH